MNAYVKRRNVKIDNISFQEKNLKGQEKKKKKAKKEGNEKD